MPDKEVTDEEIYEIFNPLNKDKKILVNENNNLKNKLKTEIDITNIEKIKSNIRSNEQSIQAIKEKIKKKNVIALNNVRKILFILYENKFAIYKRERDTNSGWLTFRWRLDLKGINHQLEREKKKLYRNLLRRKNYEEDGMFYICPNKCLRLVFDEAIDTDFVCPICNSGLVFEDNKPFIDLLNKRIIEFKS